MEQGTVLAGRWALGDLIGVGASGRVFRARRVADGAPAAVKLLHPHVLASPVLRARYEREARLAASLTHSGLCRFYDAGESHDAAWIAMELLEGTSFADWLDANGVETRERLARGLRVLRAVLEPMAALHAAGIIHRDIKPDNIFLVSSDEVEAGVKLLDLGIARDEDAVSATQTGITFGTPLYMSPEQAMDPRSCAPAADVWSFGAMLYEVLCGRPPFDGPSPASIWLAALQEPHRPVDAQVPEWSAPLRGLVDACLAKQPGARPADARAVAELWDALALELPPLHEKMTVPLRMVQRTETLAQGSPTPSSPPTESARPTEEVGVAAPTTERAVATPPRLSESHSGRWRVGAALAALAVGVVAAVVWSPSAPPPTATATVLDSAGASPSEPAVSPPSVAGETPRSAPPSTGLAAQPTPAAPVPASAAELMAPRPTTPMRSRGQVMPARSVPAASEAPPSAAPPPSTLAVATAPPPPPTQAATEAPPSAAPATRPPPPAPPPTRPPPPVAPTRPPFVTF